jgi:hypothetical protein
MEMQGIPVVDTLLDRARVIGFASRGGKLSTLNQPVIFPTNAAGTWSRREYK